MASVAIDTEAKPSTPIHVRLGNFVGYGMIFCVGLAPWPFGGNLAIAWWAINAMVMVLLLLLGLSLILQGSSRVRVPTSVWYAAILFGAVVAWIAVQASPAPVAEWANPVWALLPAELGAVPSISIDPETTREGLAKLCAYAGMFAIALLLAMQAQRAERLFKLVVVSIVLQALFGLVIVVLGVNQLFGFDSPYGGRATGTFINPNHFAGYVGLGIAACLGVLLRAIRREADTERFGSAFSRVIGTVLERRPWTISALTVCLLASVASASRGAFLALGVLLLFVLARAIGRTGPALVISTVLVLGTIGYLLLTAGGDTLWERLEGLQASLDLDPDGEGRLGIWLLAWQMIQDRPWLGHGYGTFYSVFTLYRTDQFSTVVFDYAHNSYIELAVELGLPATLALILAVWLALRPCFSALERGTSSDLPLVALMATALTALHALVDFAWQMPAVAVTWACIAGLGVGRASAVSIRVRKRRSTGDAAKGGAAGSDRSSLPEAAASP